MCQAFERSGESVHFLHPSYGTFGKRVQWEDVQEYYGLTTRFEIETVPDLRGYIDSVPQIGVLSMAVSLSGALTARLLKGELTASDVVYSRNYYGLFFFNELSRLLPARKQPTMVFEHHDELSAHLQPRLYRSIDGIVCITHSLKQFDQREYGVPTEKCFVAPDGVDLEQYDSITKSEARDRLGIPADEKVVMYTGHLYPSKGVQTLVKAAPDIEATVYIVGGFDTDIERIKQRVGEPSNVVFTGFVEPGSIPLYQVAADVLIAPYTTEARDSLSPLKLFEYMAAKRPIVASDLDILGEVLTDGHNSLLVPPESPPELAQNVNKLFSEESLYESLVENASSEVRQYTWEQRAKNIISFIQQL
nr:glycosyltransferase family 4 protein [Halapricum salinum]